MNFFTTKLPPKISLKINNERYLGNYFSLLQQMKLSDSLPDSFEKDFFISQEKSNTTLKYQKNEWIKAWDNQTLLSFFILYGDNVIGLIELAVNDIFQMHNVCILVASEYQKQGIATLCLQYIIERLYLYQMKYPTIMIIAENPVSSIIAKKLGFTLVDNVASQSVKGEFPMYIKKVNFTPDTMSLIFQYLKL